MDSYPVSLSSQINRGPESTRALELGMSNMSIMSGIHSNGSRPPGLSGSSVSSGPDEHHRRQISLGSLSLPSNDQPNAGFRDSSPASPSLQRSIIQNGFPHNIPKPPGLGGPSPSPIRNNFADIGSPGFTLTPSSSVDPNNSGYLNESGSARTNSAEPSPWADLGNGFSLAHSDNGSYDPHENDPDDGLRGLGALRERAQSSPGPVYSNSNGIFSTSPPVRIDVSAYQGELSPLHTDNGPILDARFRMPVADPRRMRNSSHSHSGRGNSRPPLHGNSQSHYFSDGSVLGSSVERYDDNTNGNDFDGRMRSLSLGEQLYDSRSAHTEQFSHQLHHIDQHSHKLGNLSSTNTVHQNRPSNQHVRSLSYTGPIQGSQELFDELRYTRGSTQTSQDFSNGFNGVSGGYSAAPRLNRSISNSEPQTLGPSPATLQRSTSLSSSTMPYGNAPQLHRRPTDFPHGASYIPVQPTRTLMQPKIQYHDDYGQSPRREENGFPVMATPEEMKSFGIGGRSEMYQRNHSFSRISPRMSPSHSPHHAPSPSMNARRHSDFSKFGATPFGIAQRVSLFLEINFQ